MSGKRKLMTAAALGLTILGIQQAPPVAVAADVVVGRPELASNTSGWTAVAYLDGSHQVHLRQYLRGQNVRDQVLGTGTAEDPSVGVDSGGDAIVVWQDSANDIAVRKINTAGTVSAVQGQDGPGAISAPRVSVDAAGSFVLTWLAESTDGVAHVDAAGYKTDGTPAYAPAQIDPGAGATDPSVGVDSAGNAAIAWTEAGHVELGRISTSGTVTRAASAVDAGSGATDNRTPAVASLANGDLVVTWSAEINGAWSTQARGFRSNLTSRFNQVSVDPGTVGDGPPSVGTDDTGGFVVGWTEGTDGYVRGFNSDGTTASRHPLERLARQVTSLAVGSDTYDASFAAVTVRENGGLDARFGLQNLTQPGTTITGPLTTVSTTGTTLSFDNSDLSKVEAAESAYPQLTPQPVSAVLASSNSTARPLCHDTHSTPSATGFCWDDKYGDDSSYAYVPQGFTELHADGRRLLVTSWYSTYDNPSGTNYVRITLIDITDPAHITYRHVLAVDPTDNANVFAPEIGHADAIVGSGHYLLLASGGDSFNVFDLNHIWKMDGSTGGVGRQADGTFSASWHLWAMPRVATFSYPVTGCGTYFNDLPCITAASLDTSTTPATLVTTEGGLFDGPQDFADQTADIVRWPIDPSTGLPAQSADGLVHATARLRTHIPSIQGGTSYKGEYVFAGPCPEFVPGMYNIPSCLYKAGLDEPTRLWTRGGINLENVFYDPPTNQLWTLSESPGSRVNYFVPLHGR